MLFDRKQTEKLVCFSLWKLSLRKLVPLECVCERCSWNEASILLLVLVVAVPVYTLRHTHLGARKDCE